MIDLYIDLYFMTTAVYLEERVDEEYETKLPEYPKYLCELVDIFARYLELELEVNDVEEEHCEAHVRSGTVQG